MDDTSQPPDLNRTRTQRIMSESVHSIYLNIETIYYRYRHKIEIKYYSFTRICRSIVKTVAVFIHDGIYNCNVKLLIN